VEVLMERFLFAYDCHLVNCVRHTRRTARQSMVLTRLKKDQGSLTPRRAALAAALACLPVLVAVRSLAVSAKLKSAIEVHPLGHATIPGCCRCHGVQIPFGYAVYSIDRWRERTLGGTHFDDVLLELVLRTTKEKLEVQY
jgi:hypothetical protein